MSNQFIPSPQQEEVPAKKKNPWIIVLIILGVLFLLCCICIAVLGLLGPAIGNVFSGIQEGLGTPLP